MLRREAVLEGQNQGGGLSRHGITRLVKGVRRGAEEDEATAVEVDDDGEFGLRWGAEGAEEAEEGGGGGVEREVFGEGNLGN